MNLRSVLRRLPVFLAVGLWLGAAAQGIPRPRIDFVYLGGPDCPYCRAWEAFDLPKLKASPSFQKVRFIHVAKKIDAPVPSSAEFPADSQNLREPIAEKLKGGGSPMFAILADG